MHSPEFLKIGDITAMLRCSHVTIYREIKRGRFPKPLKLGSASRWRASDIQEWIDKAERERADDPPLHVV